MSKKRCAVEKVISILRYFHLVGLAEAKEKSTCSTGQNSAVLHLMCQCKLLTRGKISAGGFITWLYSATAPTDSIYGKKKNSLTCKVNNPVRLHILLVTLHAPASCENKFFSEHFMYSNARGSHYYSQPLQITIIYPFVERCLFCKFSFFSLLLFI